MHPDTIVIGGGPAGASAAIRLARAGQRVRLYEKALFPRAKLCGGYLSPEGLAELEDLEVLGELRRAGSVPLTHMVIASAKGTTVDTALSGEALSISREFMDDLLLRQATNAGVDVRHGEDGFMHIDPQTTVIVAAGRQAISRSDCSPSRLSPWYASSPTAYFGMQASFEGVQDMDDQVELDLVESGYVGLASQGRGLVNVCTLTTQETIKRFGPSLDDVMAQFVKENVVLRRHLATARRVTGWLGAGPVKLGIRQLVRDNWFFVGDAACVVDPFAGEGMSIGLYSSRLLAQAMTQTALPAQVSYTQMWKKSFMPVLRWNSLLRVGYGFKPFREPLLSALALYPESMRWLADLTRLRPLPELN